MYDAAMVDAHCAPQNKCSTRCWQRAAETTGSESRDGFSVREVDWPIDQIARIGEWQKNGVQSAEKEHVTIGSDGMSPELTAQLVTLEPPLADAQQLPQERVENPERRSQVIAFWCIPFRHRTSVLLESTRSLQERDGPRTVF